jgi:hypothetical protein
MVRQERNETAKPARSRVGSAWTSGVCKPFAQNRDSKRFRPQGSNAHLESQIQDALRVGLHTTSPSIEGDPHKNQEDTSDGYNKRQGIPPSLTYKAEKEAIGTPMVDGFALTHAGASHRKSHPASRASAREPSESGPASRAAGPPGEARWPCVAGTSRVRRGYVVICVAGASRVCRDLRRGCVAGASRSASRVRRGCVAICVAGASRVRRDLRRGCAPTECGARSSARRLNSSARGRASERERTASAGPAEALPRAPARKTSAGAGWAPASDSERLASLPLAARDSERLASLPETRNGSPACQ